MIACYATIVLDFTKIEVMSLSQLNTSYGSLHVSYEQLQLFFGHDPYLIHSPKKPLMHNSLST
jgi:hypothetical protein